jgi:hypothetical protein
MGERAAGGPPAAATGPVALPEPRFSRTAIVGAAWIGLFFLNWLAQYTPPGWALTHFFRRTPVGPVFELLVSMPLMLLGFAAVAGGSVMGAVALWQIRQARGAVRGFVLALFEVLFFPLLLANAWAAWLTWKVFSQTMSAGSSGAEVSGMSPVSIAGLVLFGLILNVLLIRTAAFTAKRFVHSPAPPARPQVTGTWSQVFKAALLRLVLVVAVQLALFETLEQVSGQWKESDQELWGIALAVATLGGLAWACGPAFRLRRSWLGWLGGVAVTALLLLGLDNVYAWHLRPNLGLYRESEWVAQHPAFQKQLRASIEKNLWRKPSLNPTNASTTHSSSSGSVQRLPGDGPEEVLDLSGVRLTESDLAAIAGRTRLKRLHLSDSTISDDDLARLAGLTELRYADLSATLQNPPFKPRITDAGLEHVARWKNLSTLSLHGNPITDEGIKHLWYLPNLRSLQLGGTRVTGKTLGRIRSLTWLRLDATPIRDEDLRHLARLNRLEELYLYMTDISDAGLRYLTGLTNLRSLSLQGTQVTREGVAALKRVLPELSIGVDFPPESSAAPSGNDNFGPAREITLHDCDVQPEALDFETGRVLAVPEGTEKQLRAGNLDWLVITGVDLMTDTTRKGVGLLTMLTNELRLVKLANEDWDFLTPEGLREVLAHGVSGLAEDRAKEFGKVYFFRTNTPAPVTLGFRTGGGAEGMLQLIRFGEGSQPPVTLRYKLVQGTTSTSPPSNPASAAIPKERGMAISFSNCPVSDAVLNLAKELKLNCVIDPLLLADWKRNPATATVNASWTNITAAQAFTALLENYRLQATTNAQTSVVSVSAKGPAGQGNEKPALKKPAALLQFHWIAEDGSTSPTELWPDPSDRGGQTQLHLLRDVFLDEAAVATAKSGTNELGNAEITLHLTDDGARTLARVTDQNVGRRFAIAHQGRILSAPTVKGMVVGRELKIVGNFTEAEASRIVNALNEPRRAVAPIPTTSAASGSLPPNHAITLGNGVSVEVLAVGRNPRGAAEWWKPDGTRLAKAPVEMLQISKAAPEVQPEREFMVVIQSKSPQTKVYDIYSMNQFFAPAPDRADSALVRIDLGNSSAPILYYENPPATVDLQVAAAAGAWETVAVFDGQRTQDVAPGAMFVCGTPATNANGWVEFDIMHNVDQELYAVRVTARLADEREAGLVLHTPRGGLPKKGIVLGSLPADYPLSQVREYVLQRLPWARATIRGISLRPAQVRAISTFGPVIERVVNSPEAGTHAAALNLESGELRDLPVAWPEHAQNLNDARPALDRLRASPLGTGIHLIGGGAGSNSVILLNSRAAPVSKNEEFDTLTPSAVVASAILKNNVMSDPSCIVAHQGGPVTVLVRTRAGRYGVLQITGFTENPRGVKLRYKLVRTPEMARRLEELTPAESARALSLFNDIEDFGHEFEAAFTARNLAAAQTGTRRLAGLLADFNAVTRGTDCQFPQELFSLIQQLRQTLDTGDWEQIRQAARHNEQIARAFKRIGQRMADLARQTGFLNPTAFGPVMERVIEPANPDRRALNLAFGNFISPGPGRKLDFTEAGTNTLRAAGADLYAQEGAFAGVLTTLDMRLCVSSNPTQPEDFDNLTAEHLEKLAAHMENWRENMEAASIPGMGMDFRRATTSVTKNGLYVFITRNDVKGALQIADDPRGVKVRYKLVQAGDNPPSSTPANPDLRKARPIEKSEAVDSPPPATKIVERSADLRSGALQPEFRNGTADFR